MAKKKKAFDKYAWVAAYKNYLLTKGELPVKTIELVDFAEQTFEQFRNCFTSLQQLETAVVLLYFKEAQDLLAADEQFEAYTAKEKQLGFLYVLIEKAGNDEAFLQEFHHQKRWDKSYAIRLMRMLNEQELAWGASDSRGAEKLGKVGINPKQMALINHALTTLVFFLRDESADKQDTDAYIEKTTDLLFRLTDTSTIKSAFDLGKFLLSRKSTAFSWE